MKCIFKYIYIVVSCLDLIFKFLFLHKFLVLFFSLDMKNEDILIEENLENLEKYKEKESLYHYKSNQFKIF